MKLMQLELKKNKLEALSGRGLRSAGLRAVHRPAFLLSSRVGTGRG